MGKFLPDLLGNKGHEGMEQFQSASQHIDENALSVEAFFVRPFVKGVFAEFHIPVAEIIPDEFIDAPGGFAQFIAVQIGAGGFGGFIETGEDPAIVKAEFVIVPHAVFVAFQIHQHKAAGVPDLIGKVSCAVQSFVTEAEVVPGGVPGHQHKAERIGAVAVDFFQRVDAVAQRFTHLASLSIENEAVDQNIFEGRFPCMEQGGEDHAGNPEEDDIPTGDQHGIGEVFFHIRGLIGPAKGRIGPHGRGEPGIQHILILMNMSRAAFRTDGGIFSYADFRAAVVAVPDGDPMPPPELTGNAPVADIFHPAEIDFIKAGRHKRGIAVFHGFDGRFGQGFHFEEPLFGNEGFHGGAAAVAMTHGVNMNFFFAAETQFFQFFQHGFAAFIAVHTGVFAAGVGHFRVEVDNFHLRKVMAEADFKVVGVMEGRDLHNAGTEGLIHIFIGDNGDFLAGDGHQHGFAHIVAVTVVLGIDGESRIAEHRFRTGRGHGHELIGIFDAVFDFPQTAFFFFMFHFDIGDRRMAFRAPVDDIFITIDQFFFIESHKGFANGAGKAFVHGEAFSVPVAGNAETAELSYDAVMVFVFPCPGVFQKFLTADLFFGSAVFAQLFFNFGLGSDTGVVGTGNPQRVESGHSFIANEDILQSFVESVPHMKLTGYVGGRNHDAERLSFVVHICVKVLLFLPDFIPFFLDLFGIINRFQFSCHE